MSKMGFDEPALSVEYRGVEKGWATVGGKTCYFKSKLERRWAQYLELLNLLGEIHDWEYEPVKFEFGKIRSGTVFYTPDFWVSTGPMEHIWHEVKGHLTQKDVTKFRRMQKYHPNELLILVMQREPKKANACRILGNAEKYVRRVIYAETLLKQFGL